MRERRVTLPEIILLAATRGMIGFGAGLLLSGRFGRDRRVALGWTLLGIGALSTVPLAARVLRRPKDAVQPTTQPPIPDDAMPTEVFVVMSD